jgi:hypothetical protein
VLIEKFYIPKSILSHSVEHRRRRQRRRRRECAIRELLICTIWNLHNFEFAQLGMCRKWNVLFEKFYLCPMVWSIGGGGGSV